MSRTASSQSFEAQKNVMDQKSLVKFPDQEATPTLESLPRELKLQICREILRSKWSIELSPCTPYVRDFAFGSLGLLRVSKDFSEMALSVMYGENCFYFSKKQWTIEVNCYEDEDEYTVDISTLSDGPWQNLRDLPHTLFSNVVSPIDCLDMISQTSSGQTFVKRLDFDFSLVSWVRLMDGALLRILNRMRGLQSVNIELHFEWDETTCDLPHPKGKERQERTARDFLLLIKEELSHIKKITIGWSGGLTFGSDIEGWLSHELEKRNEAWVPPLPGYKKFRRTFSPMSIMVAEVATSIAQLEEEFKPEHHEHSILKYGVF